jgi:hypothetical protein
MVRNVQTRVIDAPLTRIGPLLEGLPDHGRPIWPAPAWSPMTLDAGLAVGSSGGHGLIRYRVSEYEPGRRARFTFAPHLGIDGWHEFALEAVHGEGRQESHGPVEDLGAAEAPGAVSPTSRTRVTHTIRGRTSGRMLLLWPLALRWLHEALVRDCFDRFERAATGTVRHPNRWSPWVRMMRRIITSRSPGRESTAW